MTRRYDAVIVGAGLGGLSAATLMALRGLDVVLLEQHNVPGGYATSFVRGPYEFEVALHELSGIGTREQQSSTWSYLDYLGVTELVEFLPIDGFYRSVFPDLDITLPIGREPYAQAVVDAFPGDEQGIRRFLDRVYAVADAMLEHEKVVTYNRPLGAGEALGLPLHGPTLARYAASTWAEILERDVTDPGARAVLSQIWAYLGLPPSKLSFLYMGMALRGFIDLGACYVKGRSQALASAFVTRFEQLGGELRLGCGVQTITTDCGRVTGVITEDDEAIETSIVISNADPITTCRDLVGADHVPASYFRARRASRAGCGSLGIYLGLAGSLEELGLHDHEVFFNASYDMDSHFQRMHELEVPQELVMACYNHVYPDISPPGTSVVSLTSLAYGEPWLDLDPHEYVDTKNRLAEGMFQMVERVYPGLRDRAEVVEVGTPVTNMRFTRQLGGAIYGFEQPPSDAAVFRQTPKGPIPGLYFAGASSWPGGGMEPAMISGRIASELAMLLQRPGRKGA
jgi:phytoene dehydrogenase-like protein